MLKIIISFALYGFIFWIVSNYLGFLGFGISNGYGIIIYIFIGGVAYMINKIIKPIISFLAIPINIITLGLTGILINIGMIYMLQYIVNSFFGESTIAISSIIGIFLLSIILSFIYKILDIID